MATNHQVSCCEIMMHTTRERVRKQLRRILEPLWIHHRWQIITDSKEKFCLTAFFSALSLQCQCGRWGDYCSGHIILLERSIQGIRNKNIALFLKYISPNDHHCIRALATLIVLVVPKVYPIQSYSRHYHFKSLYWLHDFRRKEWIKQDRSWPRQSRLWGREGETVVLLNAKRSKSLRKTIPNNRWRMRTKWSEMMMQRTVWVMKTSM